MLKYLHIFKSIIILLIGIVILLLITPVALLALLVQEKSKYAHLIDIRNLAFLCWVSFLYQNIVYRCFSLF